MLEIIPAVLPTSYEDLSNHLGLVKGKSPWVQIDVCDGRFVPSQTWPYIDGSHWNDVRSEKEGLPFWEDFQFEIDLMVEKPLAVVEDWLLAGASRLIMQVGGKNTIPEVRAAVDGRAEFAIAVSFDDDLEREVIPFVLPGDSFQIMGIGRVGYQGEAFDPRALTRMQEIKKHFPDAILSVDGGVNLDTAMTLIEAGASRLVVGSALFKTADITETLRAFKKL